MEKEAPKKLSGADDAKGWAGAQEEDIWVPPSLAGRNGNVAVQAVVGGENQSAKIQRSGRGSDGVCKRHKQTEPPWSACEKVPRVAVTGAGAGAGGIVT